MLTLVSRESKAHSVSFLCWKQGGRGGGGGTEDVANSEVGWPWKNMSVDSDPFSRNKFDRKSSSKSQALSKSPW